MNLRLPRLSLQTYKAGVGVAAIAVGLASRRHVFVAACQQGAPVPAAVAAAKPLRQSGKTQKKDLALSSEDFGLLVRAPIHYYRGTGTGTGGTGGGGLQSRF